MWMKWKSSAAISFQFSVKVCFRITFFVTVFLMSLQKSFVTVSSLIANSCAPTIQSREVGVTNGDLPALFAHEI